MQEMPRLENRREQKVKGRIAKMSVGVYVVVIGGKPMRYHFSVEPEHRSTQHERSDAKATISFSHGFGSRAKNPGEPHAHSHWTRTFLRREREEKGDSASRYAHPFAALKSRDGKQKQGKHQYFRVKVEAVSVSQREPGEPEEWNQGK